MQSCASVEALIGQVVAEEGRSVHLECSRECGIRAREALRRVQGTRRAAYYLEEDGGFDRDTVRSYLRFFARLAQVPPADGERALDHFGLRAVARTLVSTLSPEQKALLGFARLSLFQPELCFCERPLADLSPESRSLVLTWMAERIEAGAAFVTVRQPLREALLMPGCAYWEEDGQLFAAQVEEESIAEELPYEEVRVCKIAVRAGAATLLLDPREIDFIESANRVNYASVRGEMYPTALSMDQLEEQLSRFGFFRCHRSYIVNVQKVVRVERFTRNTFNLVLSDADRSSLPLSKGRAEEMRDRFGWK